MDSSLQRVTSRLDELGVGYELIRHPLAYTALEEAEAAHVPGHAFAKSVIVFADGEPRQLVLGAPHKVDFDAVKRHLGARDVRLATEAEAGSLFPDEETGIMPPLPRPGGPPLFADSALLKEDKIVFEAGSHTEAVRISKDDYVRACSPQVFSFAVEL